MPSFLPIRRIFIKNKHLPACIDCKYYTDLSQTYKHGTIISQNGKCTLFGEKNLESGEIIYHDAIKCRLNDKFCSPNAVYFEEKENKN